MHCVSLPLVIDRRTGRLEAHTMNTSANDCLVDYLLSDQRGFPCPAEFSNPSYSRSQLPQNPYALPFTSSRAQSRTQTPTTRPHSTCSSPPVFHWIRSERCPVLLMLSGDLSVSSLVHGAFLTSLRFAVHSNSSSRASACAPSPRRPTALPRVLTQTQHDTHY